jgi:hypothetical protein
MERQMAIFSCEVFDSAKSYGKLIAMLRAAGVTLQYAPKFSKSGAHPYEYELEPKMTEMLRKNSIPKPAQMEGWSYGHKKIDGKLCRVYYHTL